MTKRACAIFVISYRRAGRMATPHTLRLSGYTGPIYIVVSDDDPELSAYLEGDYPVLTYRRENYREMCDIGDTRPELTMCSQVRNALFDLAAGLSLTHFAVFDDDYNNISWRWKEGSTTRGRVMRALDRVAEVMYDTLDKSPQISCLSFAQGGDFFGAVATNVYRKMMNAMFFRTDRRVRFLGRYNDDITAYTLGQHSGGILCLTTPFVCINQPNTLSTPGGMTEAYITDGGGYTKAMYAIVRVPSAVQLAPLLSKYPRVHTRILGKYCYPRVIGIDYEDRKPV